MDRLSVGDVSITRIEEFVHWTDEPLGVYFPGSDENAWQGNSDWLVPDHWNPATKRLRTVMQSWLVRSAGRTILIDTGVGNDKERPTMPDFHQRSSAYIETLESFGVSVDDIDMVVCTHLHSDHIGWNTRLVDGTWRVTFPNADYLIARPELEFWKQPAKNPMWIGDSVEPVLQAGQGAVWDGATKVIDENIRLELAPGHTPGLTIAKIESRHEYGIFVSDVFHSPMQIAHRELGSCFCEDRALARETRSRVLEWAIDADAPIFPAHFNGSHAIKAERRPGGYAIKSWL